MTTISAAGNRRWLIPLALLLFFGIVHGDGGSLGSSPPGEGDCAHFDKGLRPSMAVIVMVLTSALFFIVFFSIYVRLCSAELGPNRPPVLRLEPEQRGLEPALIESLQTFVYSAVKQMKVRKGGTDCAVCLSEVHDGDTIRILPKCNHTFHPDCIDVWLASHVTCPLCRANLQETVPAVGDARVAAIENMEPDLANDAGNRVVISVANEEADPIGGSTLHVEAAETSLGFPAMERMRSMRKFPRSHSPGHSSVPVESLERFTIKLPENVQRHILAGIMRPLDGGSRHGGREAIEGISHWTFSITPPFIRRSFSCIPSRMAETDPLETKPNGSEPVVGKHSPPPLPSPA